MSKKTLNVITTAYRATLEEQDDTIIWLTHVMKGAGADLDVLLQGSAVNYTVRGQDASGLRFGAWQQTQPPRIDDDLAKLIGKGVRVLFCEEDLAERGVGREELIPGVEPIARHTIAKLFGGYDQIWYW
jgi:intracellular sulfur oxidation DsrE/DsrF family protein